MIAALVADLKATALAAPDAFNMVLDPLMGPAPRIVPTVNGPALILTREGHTGREYAGLVVVLSRLLRPGIRCYRPTTRGTWTRVKP